MNIIYVCMYIRICIPSRPLTIVYFSIHALSNLCECFLSLFSLLISYCAWPLSLLQHLVKVRTYVCMYVRTIVQYIRICMCIHE
jgi:hypothetical protein